MKTLLTVFLGACFLLRVPDLNAQLRADAQVGLRFGEQTLTEWTADLDLMDRRKKKKRKKRKRKHKKNNTFALGAVAGAPIGFGGRAVFRTKRLGISGDIAYNRLRTDPGPLVGAVTAKIDGRFYSKGFLAKLLRTYGFAGATIQHASFDEEHRQSVYAMDAGFGAGIKLFRLEVNAEVGLLIPVRGVETYQPRFNAFGNVGVLVWLF